MVYFYAALGVMMMTGIMAIFEMGLSLTGQSLLAVYPDEYPESAPNKNKDAALLKLFPQSSFSASVRVVGLCGALNQFDGQPWRLIPNLGEDNYFYGSCELSREGFHRSIVRENNTPGMTYQLFSCVLAAGERKCSFEKD